MKKTYKFFSRYFNGFFNKPLSYCIPIHQIPDVAHKRYGYPLPQRACLLSTDFGYRSTSDSKHFYSTFKFKSLLPRYLPTQLRGFTSKAEDKKGKAFVIQGCYNIISNNLDKGIFPFSSSSPLGYYSVITYYNNKSNNSLVV